MKKSMLAVFVSAVLVMAGCGSFGVSAMDQKTTEKEIRIRTEAAEPIEHASFDAMQVRRGPAHVETVHENAVTAEDDEKMTSDSESVTDPEQASDDEQAEAEPCGEAEQDMDSADGGSENVTDEDDSDTEDTADIESDGDEADADPVSESDYDGAIPYDEQNFTEGAEGPEAGTEISPVGDVDPLPDDEESVSEASETEPFTEQDVEQADADGADVNLDELEAGGSRAE